MKDVSGLTIRELEPVDLYFVDQDAYRVKMKTVLPFHFYVLNIFFFSFFFSIVKLLVIT